MPINKETHKTVINIPEGTIVGKNTAGFTLAFAKDKETVIDAEFAAIPSDAEGTLIIYKEEMEGSESV